MINNYKEFKEYLNSITNKPKLLLHCCCGPCSTHTITVLNDYFDVTLFFDNSNIDTLTEYNLRFNELIKVAEKHDIKIINSVYNPQSYYEAVKGHENDGEFSVRCYNCMKLRMENTFKYALDNGYVFFTTTLSISPYKNSDWINKIGYELENDCVKFLYSNFKKEEGYKNSIALSKELNLYRQHYCGCIFSKNELKEKSHE